MTIKEHNRRVEFVNAYKNLMDKHGLYIAGYNDCGSPWVIALDETGWNTTSQREVDRLIGGLE